MTVLRQERRIHVYSRVTDTFCTVPRREAETITIATLARMRLRPAKTEQNISEGYAHEKAATKFPPFWSIAVASETVIARQLPAKRITFA